MSECARFLHTIMLLIHIKASSFRIYYKEPINSVMYGKEKNRGV